ncbi:TlpA disulfide reductase family protein [Mariniblastus fucicola]|uniref:Thiol-disulfide oxidoreductase ResA n=1 Tax=Mariniblastus fucicola TaxID=980251 RepID=A0A5B9PG52_9BACT|nr:TlpA disulfide reductase family protein [Mariniblastus fucicola]QEG21743.1 Thiol-disulfide oxidoreductase ResA [Mariniblastus fucicola]
MNCFRPSSFLITGLVAALGFHSLFLANDSYANENRPKLSVGSKAPKLDIEHWLSMPDGFEEVKRFKKGNVYVVEFWATWCGPCRRAIPHISEVAEKYAEQGVQVISVSSEKLKEVEVFLPKRAKKDSPETFAELTSKYCLTCDPDGSVRKEIFRAAGQTGIPSAFIIGKTGHVEWIGYPTRIDGPLEQVVEGTWDRDAFKETFERNYRLKRNKKEIAKHIKENKHNLAVNQIFKMVKDYEGRDRQQWQLKGLEICLENGLRRTEKDFKNIAKEHFKDATMMNSMAWSVVSATEKGAELKPEILELARTAIDLSVKAERSAASLDTLAHIAELEGNLEEAIEVQTEAVEKADEKIKAELEAYLESLVAKRK